MLAQARNKNTTAAQDGKNEDTSALIETVNKTGKAFLITTDLSGRTVARIACGGFLTQACGFPPA